MAALITVTVTVNVTVTIAVAVVATATATMILSITTILIVVTISTFFQICDSSCKFYVQATVSGSQDFRLRALQWSPVAEHCGRLFGISLRGFIFEVIALLLLTMLPLSPLSLLLP